MLAAIKQRLVKTPILSVIFFLGSAFLLLYPGDRTPDNLPAIPFLDKIVHFLIFTLLVFSIYFDLVYKKDQSRLFAKTFFVVIGLVIYGLLVELLQEHLLKRSGSYDDFLADFLGILFGLLLAIRYSPIFYNWLTRN